MDNSGLSQPALRSIIKRMAISHGDNTGCTSGGRTDAYRYSSGYRLAIFSVVKRFGNAAKMASRGGMPSQRSVPFSGATPTNVHDLDTSWSALFEHATCVPDFSVPAAYGMKTSTRAAPEIHVSWRRARNTPHHATKTPCTRP